MAVMSKSAADKSSDVLQLSPKEEKDIYAQLLTTKGLELQAQYIRQFVSQDVLGMWKTFGEEMLYHTIADDDSRVKDETNKSFKAAGIEKDTRHDRDYRHNISYLGKWLYADIARSYSFFVSSLEHVGKRVEGTYEGNSQFESVKHTVKVYLADTVKQVDTNIEGMKSICSKSGVKFPFSNEQVFLMRDKAFAAYRVYKVFLDKRVYYPAKTIGYIVIHRDFSNPKSSTVDFEAFTIIDYNALIDNWIVIDPFMNQLLGVLPNLFKSNSCRISNVVDFISRTDFAESQADIIASNSLRVKELHEQLDASLARAEELKRQREEAKREAKKKKGRKTKKVAPRYSEDYEDDYDPDYFEDDEDYEYYEEGEPEFDLSTLKPEEIKGLWDAMSTDEKKGILASLDEATRNFVISIFGGV